MTDKPATLIECLAHMPLPPSIPAEALGPNNRVGEAWVSYANVTASLLEPIWRKEAELLYSPAENEKRKTYILDAAHTDRNQSLLRWWYISNMNRSPLSKKDWYHV